MTIQLALRKHDTRIAARVIQWWTGSIYSHCELVIDGPPCAGFFRLEKTMTLSEIRERAIAPALALLPAR